LLVTTTVTFFAVKTSANSVHQKTDPQALFL